jgi:glyoxylase-like metal-dependent hydrolase (beta-lactamase superfamily II)
MKRQLRTLFLLLFATTVLAEDLPALSITKVSDSVYSAIGETLPPSYENWGHNNNLSFIVSNDGVMVVNGGDNYLLAKALHQQIKKITRQPVKWLVNENGQGHSMLGNSYWAEQQGVAIIAQKDAVKAFSEEGELKLKNMQARNKERAEGTTVAVPTLQFNRRKTIQLGDIEVQLLSFGEAHSAGDISVWLPEQKIIIAGDIAFHERLLAIFPETKTGKWLLSFEKMMALEPEIVIPGHGHPTDMAIVKKTTYDYLVFLRSEVEALLEEDLGLTEAYQIDQSAYLHLDTFDELAKKNAGRVFQQMEMDFF